VSRRPGRIWMLSSAATQSVACEHSSRLRTRMTAFSPALPIEPSPSLRVVRSSDLPVRGRTPPRPSTSATPLLRSCAPSSPSRALASCRRRGAARSAHGWDLDRGYCDCTAAKAAYFQPLGGLCVLARVPSSSRPLANQLPNISDTETDADMDAETDMDTEMETGYENGDTQLRPP
jgi:hypothetical protein